MNILHFIRKITQLNTPFILNQIVNTYDCIPAVAFRVNNEYSKNTRHVDNAAGSLPFLDLSYCESFYESFLFNTFKILSKKQTNKLISFIEENNINICHFNPKNIN